MADTLLIERLKAELREMKQHPIPGILIGALNETALELNVTLFGLEGTPYHTGVYQLVLEFNGPFGGYPDWRSPSMCFLTKIYHVSVNPFSSGRVQECFMSGVDYTITGTYPSDFVWKPSMTLAQFLPALRRIVMTKEGHYKQPARHDIATLMHNNLLQFIQTIANYNEWYASGQSAAQRGIDSLQNYPFLTTEQCEQRPAVLRECMMNEYDISDSLVRTLSCIVFEYDGNRAFEPFYAYEPWIKYCTDRNYYANEQVREEQTFLIKQAIAGERLRCEQQKLANDPNYYRLSVKTLTGKTFDVYCESNDDVLMLTLLIEASDNNYAAKQTRLNYRGRELRDERLLSDYDIEAEPVVHCLFKLRN